MSRRQLQTDHTKMKERLLEGIVTDTPLEGCIDDFTRDGTVDIKGNLASRHKTGGWTACSFIIVYELFERIAYFGISSNLVLYMTKELHQGTVKSANNVTNWIGVMWTSPILGAYIADAYLGRYWTLVFACFIYLLGMFMLTLSVSLPSLKPPNCEDTIIENCKKASPLQLAVFFGALYTLALGTGGTKPNISTIGADQFDDFDPKEKVQKLSFFNWWLFCIFVGIFFANTVLVYVQDNVSWSLGYGLPTLGLAISIVIFLAGTQFYRHKLPVGSPFTRMAKVFVAAIRKWRLRVPDNHTDLDELDPLEYDKKGEFRTDSTSSFRFLNKACVTCDSTSEWMLCPASQVEETKQLLRLIPIWVATFIPSCTIAQMNTLFVKQGTTLDRHIIGSFEIPPATLTTFTTLSMLVSIVLYDRFFVPIMQRWTKNARGITLLQRMGIGLIIHVLVMVTASAAEGYRLKVAIEHALAEKGGGQVPLSIFILLPQFLLMGLTITFLDVAKIDFFYDQAPEGMKSLGTSFSITSEGLGSFLSTFLLSTVSQVTSKHGHGWILNNLNESRLDYYYCFLAILNVLNFAFFLAVAKAYVYREKVIHSLGMLKE